MVLDLSVPLEHLMKVHNPAVRCSSCPIPEGPRVPCRPLGVSGKGTYPNVNGIVNITDMYAECIEGNTLMHITCFEIHLK